MDIDKLWKEYEKTIPMGLSHTQLITIRLAFNFGILFYIKGTVGELIDTSQVHINKAMFIRDQLDNQLQVHNSIAVQYFSAPSM